MCFIWDVMRIWRLKRYGPQPLHPLSWNLLKSDHFPLPRSKDVKNKLPLISLLLQMDEMHKYIENYFYILQLVPER